MQVVIITGVTMYQHVHPREHQRVHLHVPQPEQHLLPAHPMDRGRAASQVGFLPLTGSQTIILSNPNLVQTEHRGIIVEEELPEVEVVLVVVAVPEEVVEEGDDLFFF